MLTPNKNRSTALKRKGSVVVRSKAKIVKKGEIKAKNDTLQTQIPRTNGAVLKVKIKRK